MLVKLLSMVSIYTDLQYISHYDSKHSLQVLAPLLKNKNFKLLLL